MTPGLTWSSDASFSITIPGIATYSTQRIRSNVADGWGTLTTPYGTFPTLRVKSNLAIHDSVYIDTLGIGFPLNRNITEYKWLANGKGIPVLQIDEEGPLVTATYRDIYRMSGLPINVSLGPDTTVLSGTTLTLHAAISGGNPPYQIIWSTLDTGNDITVTVEENQTFSVIVIDAVQNFGAAQKVVTVTFPVEVGENSSTRFRVYPNPSQGKVCFMLPEKTGNAMMQVFSPQGKVVLEKQIYIDNQVVNTNIRDLANGIYFIRILAKNSIYSARIQISK
jgi:hypothetical protein